MPTMDNLSFDPVKVDTSLAEEYIKKNVFEEPKPGTAWDYKKKSLLKIDQIYPRALQSSIIPGVGQKLRNLSKKILDNTELFCQLEYLLRKTDVDETRNCHLKLISQYLRFDVDIANKLHTTWIKILLDENTPLYCLGHVATAFNGGVQPILCCKKSTAPLCQLFYELCLVAGLEMDFYCLNSSDCDDRVIYKLPTMDCTLVITEEADIDSALDVFLNSSLQAPWRIERIYVQESVYEEVVEAVEGRCERVASERCVEAFRTARGRRVECGAGAGAGGGGVPVRAYRGACDLLALLPPGGALSLWCGAAAAAHELALAAPADLVWIDDYAAFDGPPAASLPLYDCTFHLYYIRESVHTRLSKLQEPWIALPADERKAVVLDVLGKFSARADGTGEIAQLIDGIAAWTPADIVDIASDRITMVIYRPHTDIIPGVYGNMLELLKSAIRGYRIVIQDDVLNVTFELCKAGVPFELCKAGVPVMKTLVLPLKTQNPDYPREIKSKLFYSNTKVIHSRFGTIYSN